MKKHLSLFLTFALLLFSVCCLTGCSASGGGNSTSASGSAVTEAAQTDAAAQTGTGSAAGDSAGTQTAAVPAEAESGTAADSTAAAPAADDSGSAAAQDAPAAADAEPLTAEEIAEYAQTSYNDLVSSIMLNVQEGWQSGTPEDLGISTIYAIYPDSSFGFSIQDINSDGIPELLLGETMDNDASSPIYDLFTADETGSLVHVFSGGERDRCYLYENGTLANLASSGADDSSFIHYILEDGILVADDSGESGGNYVDIAFQYFTAS